MKPVRRGRYAPCATAGPRAMSSRLSRRWNSRNRPVAIDVRNTRPADFPGIIAICRAVYPESPPWQVEQLANHVKVFPEGQWVAVEGDEVVGMAASLVILWDNYGKDLSWRDFTAHGTFSNHD